MTQSEDIVVRLAVEADAAWCCFTATLAGPNLACQRPGLRDLVVAERAGARVGLLVIDYLWAGLPHAIPLVSLVDVVRGHQRRGVGKAMLAFAEAHLRAAGHRVLLSSCTVDEPEPQAWHRRVGFRDCGAWDAFGDQRGEVFYYKRLDEPNES